MGIMLNVLFKCWVRFPERTYNSTMLILTRTCHKGIISYGWKMLTLYRRYCLVDCIALEQPNENPPRFCDDKVLMVRNVC